MHGIYYIAFVIKINQGNDATGKLFIYKAAQNNLILQRSLQVGKSMLSVIYVKCRIKVKIVLKSKINDVAFVKRFLVISVLNCTSEEEC